MKSKSVFFCLAAMAISASKVSATVHMVTVRNFEFDPSNVNVQIGDTVMWVRESGSHTVTSGQDCIYDKTYFQEPINSSFPTYSYVIPANAPPTIPYFCEPHCPIMVGSITVTNAVPTMSQWGLILTLVVLVGVGALIVSRRTRASAAAAQAIVKQKAHSVTD